MSKLLTKSKYIIGLQCPKYLWTAVNAKEQIPPPDLATQHRFDEGSKVGEFATKLYPMGTFVKGDFMENIRKSKTLLAERRPLFEAGFMVNNCFSRVDILNPVEDDAWDIIEVKSATKTKEVNIDDVSFQRYCYENAGIKIRKCFLMHINNQYVRQGDIDPQQLFTLEDITEEVEKASHGIEVRIKDMLEIINSAKPEEEIGPHCSDPYACPLIKECWKFLPKNHVFNLYRGKKLGNDLFQSGILAIKDIPEDYKLSVKQRIQLNCAKSEQTHIDKEALSNFISQLEYPIHFLDFETYSTVIPLYDNLKPYQRVPFQFSLHILNSLNDKPQHYSFLAEGSDDPRRAFLDNMKKMIGEKGSIVVYNQAFEIGVMKELVAIFPEDEEWVSSIIKRVEDLLIPFRAFDYYNPSQQGSASVKKVLPALTGKTYDNMDIHEGEGASIEYARITHTEVTEEDRQKIRADLEEYCGLDTEGLIFILRELDKIINQ